MRASLQLVWPGHGDPQKGAELAEEAARLCRRILVLFPSYAMASIHSGGGGSGRSNCYAKRRDESRRGRLKPAPQGSYRLDCGYFRLVSKTFAERGAPSRSTFTVTSSPGLW